MAEIPDGNVVQAGRPWPEGNTKTVRLAIAGLDAHGADFFWHEHPNCKVVAVADPDSGRRKRLQDRYQCDTALASLDEILRDVKELDAVAIFTGIPERFHDSMRCMERGLHVITEVPACGSLEQAEKLIEVKKRTGMRYMLAEGAWYKAETVHARNLYRAGILGEVFYTEADYNHDRGDLSKLITDKTTRHYNPDGTRSWRWGYPLFFYPTHNLAYITGITGDRVLSVSSFGWGTGDHPFLTDNVYNFPFWNQSALFELSNGHSARCNRFTVFASGIANRAQLFGDKATYYMSLSDVHGPVLHFRSEAPESPYDLPQQQGGPLTLPEYSLSAMIPPQMRREGAQGSALFMTAEFINAIIDERETETDVYQAVAMTVPGLLAHESAMKDGERLKVPQFI